MKAEIRSPKSDKEWVEYYDLRYRVLRKPWNQPRGSERNDGDESGLHFALFESGIIKAIARLDESAPFEAQVRFVAVEFNNQGCGYGRLIMEACENLAKNRGDLKMILHAREVALDFYKRLDYKLVEKSHLLFGEIQHYLMVKVLD
ncbi:MAG: GNAT family N-acetyltransferase [Crocinitomicaceae bacterium]